MRQVVTARRVLLFPAVPVKDKTAHCEVIMIVPVQVSPVTRHGSSAAGASDKREGVNPSNAQLQCQLCCAIGRDDCGAIVPGCTCPR